MRGVGRMIGKVLEQKRASQGSSSYQSPTNRPSALRQWQPTARAQGQQMPSVMSGTRVNPKMRPTPTFSDRMMAPMDPKYDVSNAPPPTFITNPGASPPQPYMAPYQPPGAQTTGNQTVTTNATANKPQGAAQQQIQPSFGGDPQMLAQLLQMIMMGGQGQGGQAGGMQGGGGMQGFLSMLMRGNPTFGR